jgi:NTP pyrophosphatase (non-canonical NTP hydrolase)
MKTTLDDFQKFFVEHQKNYKVDEANRLAVLALGLSGECGEVTELIKKHLRDGNLHPLKIAEELGDVLAYVAILADYYGFTLEEIAKINFDKNKRRTEQGTLQTERKE